MSRAPKAQERAADENPAIRLRREREHRTVRARVERIIRGTVGIQPPNIPAQLAREGLEIAANKNSPVRLEDKAGHRTVRPRVK